ncbi:MAG: hypothetical protein N2255_03255, partial [Kiritimatiellae bacterium]|nr:hypothetical protein [Kiritimatiellia bacterium]
PCAVLMFMIFLVAGYARAQEVKVGDDLETVVKVLGAPKGWIQAGSVQVYYYDLGRVEMKDGRVTRVELMTPEEAALLAEQREARLRQQEKELAARRRELVAEGMALKEKMLASPDFTNAPASFQVEFWKEFMTRYPDVPVEAEYATARARLAAEEAERRLKELEQRVAEAENRARHAEEVADDRARRSDIVVQYYPPVQVVPWPIIWYQPCDPSRPTPGREQPSNEPRPPRAPARTGQSSSGTSRRWLEYVPAPSRREVPASWPFTPFPRIQSISPLTISPLP